MKTQNNLTVGLIISTFILSFSLCGFIWGYQLCISHIPKSQQIGLITFIVTFFSSLIAVIFIVRCKHKLDILCEYGKPVYLAAQGVKKVIHRVNTEAVNELNPSIEKVMKQKLTEVKKSKK